MQRDAVYKRAEFGEPRLYIDGELRESGSGRTFEALSPLDRGVIGVAAEATDRNLDAAVEAARRCFDEGRPGVSSKGAAPVSRWAVRRP